MDGSLTSGREGSDHGGAVHLCWRKVDLNMQKDGAIPVSYFPEFQHIYMGITFHGRAQAVSRLEKTFWLKEETPATASLDGKEQQKGDMNSEYWDKIKWDFLHTKGGIALLLQRALIRRIPLKRLVWDSAETQMALCNLRILHEV